MILFSVNLFFSEISKKTHRIFFKNCEKNDNFMVTIYVSISDGIRRQSNVANFQTTIRSNIAFGSTDPRLFDPIKGNARSNGNFDENLYYLDSKTQR